MENIRPNFVKVFWVLTALFCLWFYIFPGSLDGLAQAEFVGQSVTAFRFGLTAVLVLSIVMLNHGGLLPADLSRWIYMAVLAFVAIHSFLLLLGGTRQNWTFVVPVALLVIVVLEYLGVLHLVAFRDE